MGRFLELHDLDGEKTSIAVNAIVGVSQSTYEETWEETEPVEEPSTLTADIIEGWDNWPKWRKVVVAPVAVVVGVLEIVAAFGKGREEPEEPRIVEKTRTHPCTVIHMQVGSRTKRLRVKEPYEQVVADLAKGNK